MAVFYANNIAALSAPTVLGGQNVNVSEGHGRIRFRRVEIELPDTANADTIRFCSFKTTDRLLSMKIAYDDLGTAGTLDIGLAYAGAAHNGAVIDDDLFASALDLSTAAVAQTEVLFEAAATLQGATYMGKTLWEWAALTEDPGGFFDIYGITDTGTTVAGTVVLMFEYVSGD